MGKHRRLRPWVKVVLWILFIIVVVRIMVGAYQTLANGPKNLQEALEVNGYHMTDYGYKQVWSK